MLNQTVDFGLHTLGENYAMRGFRATILRLPGLHPHKLWYLHNGLHEKLTDFAGKVIEQVLAWQRSL